MKICFRIDNFIELYQNYNKQLLKKKIYQIIKNKNPTKKQYNL